MTRQLHPNKAVTNAKRGPGGKQTRPQELSGSLHKPSPGHPRPPPGTAPHPPGEQENVAVVLTPVPSEHPGTGTAAALPALQPPCPRGDKRAKRVRSTFVSSFIRLRTQQRRLRLSRQGGPEIGPLCPQSHRKPAIQATAGGGIQACAWSTAGLLGPSLGRPPSPSGQAPSKVLQGSSARSGPTCRAFRGSPSSDCRRGCR